MIPDLPFLLAHFGVTAAPHQIDDLQNASGFSGAHLWKVRTAHENLCLRRWPPEADPERLASIHSVIAHAARSVNFLPVPRTMIQGTTLLQHDGHCWELSPWMPGEANYYEQPSPAKLSAALVALAQFHETTADLATDENLPSPGLVARLRQLEEWQSRGCQQLQSALSHCSRPELIPRAQQTLQWFQQHAPAVRRQLQAAVTHPVPLQPCIRDIWHDHVLFTDDQVTGIVDFGAMRQESVAGDVARLLGSLVRDDPEAWQAGLSAYQAVRPLDREETMLVDAFDRSGVLLANMNWLSWILLEGRQFADMGRVLARMDETLLRLEQLGALNPLDSGRVQGIARWASSP